MNRKWIALVLLTLGANFACAASFDCDKASTKVEKMICADSELSRLDNELGVAYDAALKESSDTSGIKQRQHNWLKVRNQCHERSCIKSLYQKRIHVLAVIAKKGKVDASHSADETYDLIMSKNDDVCNYMRQIMVDDLHQFGRGYDSNDRFVSTHDVFNAVPWMPTRASFENSGKERYTGDDQLESATFDFNNDGALDYVVRDKGMLSGMRADALYMFDLSIASKANDLTTKELFNAKDRIELAGNGYPLSEPLEGFGMMWLLSPFIYKDVSYLYLQSLYKTGAPMVGDFVVIAKYSGGIIGHKTTSRMEDVCYIKRANGNN